MKIASIVRWGSARLRHSSRVGARSITPRRFTHRHRQHLERAAEHYLRECYRGKTRATVAEFASTLECHPDYLTRTAAGILGASLLDYLRGKQLEEAERLITTTPLSMREVAFRSGFGTTATFYRCFRAAHDMPPGSFRKVRK
jgi:AraC-like DNA-binding protein